MSRFLKSTVSAVATVLALTGFARADGDIVAGKAKFQQCAACHRVGEGARNALGPELNDVIGRKAGSLDGFNYSTAMKKKGAEGLVWNEETLDRFLASPMKFIKGTRMAFPGLRDETDRENVIAYLKSFSKQDEEGTSNADETKSGSAAPDKDERSAASDTGNGASSQDAKAAAKAGDGQNQAKAARPVSREIPDHGVYHLGRKALPEEIQAWNVDVRPDGTGLPEGHGTAAEGEQIFTNSCASCHGDFGEGVGRWPVLSGGQDSLTDQRPVKTVGSYWPYLSTVYDYIRRAMPFGNAHSLSNDDVYALTAYILALNYIVDEDFELSKENFTSITMPNADGFIDDNRLEETHYANKSAPPCMKDCKDEPVRITMHAQVLDVTPDAQDDENADQAGGIE